MVSKVIKDMHRQTKIRHTPKIFFRLQKTQNQRNASKTNDFIQLTVIMKLSGFKLLSCLALCAAELASIDKVNANNANPQENKVCVYKRFLSFFAYGL